MDYGHLFFIGEKPCNGKPDFYDALRISTQNGSYQSIPLSNKFLLNFYDSNIRISYDQHTLKLESRQPLTNEEALNIFQNFAVKKGKKVAYLADCPSFPIKRKKTKLLRERREVSLD